MTSPQTNEGEAHSIAVWNSNGNLKLKPLFIYHNEILLVFKKHIIKRKHVIWRAKQQSLGHQAIFYWVTKWSVWSLRKKKFLQKDLPLKVLLLNNVPAHTTSLKDDLLEKLRFITVSFLTPTLLLSSSPWTSRSFQASRSCTQRHFFRNHLWYSVDPHIILERSF